MVSSPEIEVYFYGPVAQSNLTENNLDQMNPEDYGPDGIEDDEAYVFHHWG
jgi:hypothetical protein